MGLRVRGRWARFLVPMLVAFCAGAIPSPAGAATTNVGYPDYAYGAGSGTLTTSKPESKLWFAGGSWWASMLDPASLDHHIYRLDRATERWIDTGTVLDPRPSARADVLWDAAHNKLYVASHVWATEGTDSGAPARLWRFSFNGATGQYTLDGGFPADINKASTESLVIAKDSTGKLWATWTMGTRVYVSHTTTSDAKWAVPYALPTSGAAVAPGDVASIIAFAGTKIGVMWNNSTDGRFWFATHADGGPDGASGWSASGIPIPGGLPADDHINLKTDSAGRVYAAVKFGTTVGLEPFLALLIRDTNGSWAMRTVVTVSDSGTRPIVLLDEQHQRLHVLYTGPEPPSTNGQNGGTIYDKSSALGAVSFAPGPGTPVIRDAVSPALNDVTSTKQNVNAASGIVVLASNPATNEYWHGDIRLDGSTPPPSPPPPPPPPPAPLTFTFPAIADAQVKSTSPTGNFGTLDSLTVRKDTSRSYLKFAVSGLRAQVLSAKLQLKSASATSDGGDVYPAPATWNESQLTWSNAPALTDPPLARIGPVMPGPVAVDLPANVFTGDGTYSFALAGGDTTSTIYSSREGGDPPQLVLTTAPPPPPPPPPPPRRARKPVTVRVRNLLHHRFVYRTRCTRACRVSAAVRARGWGTIAHARASRRRAGTARLVFRVPSRKVARRLARRTRVSAIMTITVVYPRAHKRFALHRAVRIASR